VNSTFSSKKLILFLLLSLVILINLFLSLPFLGFVESKVVWNNDSLGFWMVQNSGSGKYQLTISNRIAEDGTESLYINRITGNYSLVYIYRDFDPILNWSDYNYLEIWFYGKNTGGEMGLWLRSDNNWDERSFYQWSDVWVGWKRITFLLQNPTYTGSSGGANLSAIDMIGVDGLTQHFIGSGALLKTNSYLPYIRGENLNDRVFVYAAINAFGSAIFLFMLWFTFVKKEGSSKKRSNVKCLNSVGLHG
jgi:hypothetical protein